MELDGEFEKAAGLTFLYFADLNKTIECLNASKQERLILVAAALAGGFGKSPSSDSNKAVWKSLCKSLSHQLKDPYLKALFTLMASEGSWSLVLSETSLPLCDRMVMALRFLEDGAVSLQDFMNSY